MKVHEIFRSIQGEGKLAGTPMTFIRLYGCNMQPRCSFCDTPQESNNYTEMSIEDIVNKMGDDWVCITGGEPTTHKELQKLVDALRNKRHIVALETNGIRKPPLSVGWTCISPKEPWPSQNLLNHCDEIKLLVGSGMYDVEEVLTHKHGGWHSGWQDKTSLLPVWDDNYKDNLAKAIELCQSYQVRLATQTHKYLEIQ